VIRTGFVSPRDKWRTLVNAAMNLKVSYKLRGSLVAAKLEASRVVLSSIS
jgi:hypothetical protein